MPFSLFEEGKAPTCNKNNSVQNTIADALWEFRSLYKKINYQSVETTTGEREAFQNQVQHRVPSMWRDLP